MEWDDDIHDLFEQFVEEVNQVPFNTEYENTPEFRLNQSIINNAYLLRRTIELYPDEQQNFRRLRQSSRSISRSIPPHNPQIVNIFPPVPLTPLFSPLSFSDDENEINIQSPYTQSPYTQSPYTQRFRQSIQTPILDSLDSQITTNLTDSIFESLFTNFNQFMEENLNDLEDVKVTLSIEEFNNLDVVIDELLIKNKQCNICLEDLQKDELSNKSLIQLQCNHIYHNICIKEWLTKQSTKCPSCRFCCRTQTQTQTSTNSE
jgi:hypothetical protein